MKETTWSILCPDLDKLRNKELSFWCVIRCEWKESYILWHHINRTRIPSADEYCYKIMSLKLRWEDISSNYNNFEWYDILWHPLTWWRIEHLSDLHWTEQMHPNATLDAIQEQYDTIHMIDIFLTWYFLKDQNELQRMEHEKRPELKELLIQFASYF